ncbi:hypothetical protein ACFYOA_24675 [Streptomyces iakyrus]|uniref:hypothetical protein n=1 Tax=Streptomyces iakyrus TaxID=68219 RepID=UPI0036A8702A
MAARLTLSAALELTYQPLDLPVSAHEAHALTLCTAEPGTAYKERLKFLASWAATGLRRRTPPVTGSAERRPVRGEASRTRPDADGGRALLVRTIVGTGRRTGHA